MEEALFKVLSFITFIMLGYLLRRLSILKAETFRVLSGIVFYITLPCIIITSINGVPVTSEMLWLVALGALCNVLMVATGYGMTHGKARQERAFSMLNLSGYNIGTFAMPFVAGFLPPTGFLATCLFDAGNAIMCTGGTYALANSVTDASQHLSIKSFLRNVFSSIPFCIYLIMIVMAFLHLALPLYAHDRREHQSANGQQELPVPHQTHHSPLCALSRAGVPLLPLSALLA